MITKACQKPGDVVRCIYCRHEFHADEYVFLYSFYLCFYLSSFIFLNNFVLFSSFFFLFFLIFFSCSSTEPLIFFLSFLFIFFVLRHYYLKYLYKIPPNQFLIDKIIWCLFSKLSIFPWSFQLPGRTDTTQCASIVPTTLKYTERCKK